MKQKEFKTIINAPKEKVWRVLWSKETYPIWTAPFCEGSRAETDWQEGGKVLFLGSNNNGMLSRILSKIANEYMSFEHQGVVKNGKEDLTGADAKSVQGAQENYILQEKGGTTELKVGVDITEEYSEYFQKTFHKALQIVKELSEQ
ncbi:activator of Hsp90 ATPase-like protein [Gillisia sp. Hel_I_86]|uniref:SRPBCC domain-containing protein n=1 Tax=Gillisia sp. Hel_I_86 TaxID=1249981 RepID=UPI00119A3794|nr:SRPBCC domain-containing protein [Gillisia sp. Hel_I_86]TVZ26925.1 activator of Hsp90 ATPase-like protein [Gillisia sp. Hel_I_86]